MWWLRRSISKTSASACRSACAAASPAKPPPMITTRLRSPRGDSTTAVASARRLSANIALMDHLVRALGYRLGDGGFKGAAQRRGGDFRSAFKCGQALPYVFVSTGAPTRFGCILLPQVRSAITHASPRPNCSGGWPTPRVAAPRRHAEVPQEHYGDRKEAQR